MRHKHHIIPKHAGGTDDISNIIELTPAEHAEAHRLLYEQYGRWQDYVAWQGLAKLSENEKLIKIKLSESGKLGAAISNANGGWRVKNPEGAEKQRIQQKEFMKNQRKIAKESGKPHPGSKSYIVTYPDGKIENVLSLRNWCIENNFKYNTVFNQCVGRGKSHRGFRIKLQSD